MAYRWNDYLLCVIDFSFDQDTDPHVVVDYPPLLSDHASPQSSLKDILAILPSQPPQTIRLLLEGVYFKDSHDAFVSYLKKKIPRNAPTQYNFNASSSLASVLAQCDEYNGAVPYWGFGITRFFLAPAHPKPKRWDTSLAGILLPKAHLWKDENDCVFVHLNCAFDLKNIRGDGTYGYYHLDETLNVPRELARILEQLEPQYKIVTKNITLSLQDRTTLFVLRLFHSKILIQQRSLDNFKQEYDNSLEQITLGRALTTKLLQEIAYISNYADRQHSEVKAVSLVVEALLDVLSPSLEESVGFQKLNRNLRAISNSLTISTGELAPRMEARLKFFEISRNIQESTSLWLLSLLAAIFLPLSLASSLLSMQTRLTELHYLLYDFFGVIVLFGSGALLIILVMKKVAKTNGSAHGVLKIQGINRISAVLAWATVVASFLIGMIIHVDLGLKILGIGVAANIGMLALCMSLRWVAYNYRYSLLYSFARSLYRLDRWLD